MQFLRTEEEHDGTKTVTMYVCAYKGFEFRKRFSDFERESEAHTHAHSLSSRASLILAAGRVASTDGSPGPTARVRGCADPQG